VFLVLIALISASGGIYATVVSRKKTGAEAMKTEVEAEQTSDKTWIQRLDALSNDLGRLQLLSDERFERLVELEMLITEHVTWDFTVVRLLRQHGIDIHEPPSLVYVRRKLAEEKNAIKKEMGSEEITPET
jgi:hypothetical protein